MHLFSPLRLRGVTVPNRLVVSPMCLYSSVDGFAHDWHLVHLGSRAVSGAGIVFCEAAAVDPHARITPEDLGIWKDEHVEMLARIAGFIKRQGVVAGMQLAHAGPKGPKRRPWDPPPGALDPEHGGWPAAIDPVACGWPVVGATTKPYGPGYHPSPTALDEAGIAGVVQSFADATRRTLAAGFDLLELHFAHGFLAHQFYSPISNTRTDRYGGSLENRIRFSLEVVDGVRAVWPDRLPLFVRISVTDWVPGGWDVGDSVEFAKKLHERGVDLIDCSSGGIDGNAKIPIGPLYQVPAAERIRRESGVPTGAVGLITTPEQCESIVARGQADLVLLAREFLRDPYFPLFAADALDADLAWPPQYERAREVRSARRATA